MWFLSTDWAKWHHTPLMAHDRVTKILDATFILLRYFAALHAPLAVIGQIQVIACRIKSNDHSTQHAGGSDVVHRVGPALACAAISSIQPWRISPVSSPGCRV
jgi:hypothetical protein